MNIAGDGHLVEAVRKRRCLWDNTSPEYKLARMRKQQWEEVAIETGRAVKDVQSRWKNIKDYRAKKLTRLPSGSGESGASADTSAYLRTLSFLDPVIAPRSVLTNTPNAGPGPAEATLQSTPPRPVSPVLVLSPAAAEQDIDLGETYIDFDIIDASSSSIGTTLTAPSPAVATYESASETQAAARLTATRRVRERQLEARPSTAGPVVADPAVAGPSVAAPAVAGPSVADPAVAGPSVAAPAVAGPSVAAPAVAGPSAAGPSAEGPTTEPDPQREARRARRRSSGASTAPAPACLHGEMVQCLKDIGEAATGVEDCDQLFCNAIAGELRTKSPEEKRRLKAEICRIMYG